MPRGPLKVRDLTDRPVGANLMIWARLHDAGMTVVHVVGSRRWVDAQSALSAAAARF